MPPAWVARHEISRPLVVAGSRTPATATLARAGDEPELDAHGARRARRSRCVVEAAIGAPQCAPQHHDETASGTRFAPDADVRGGRARDAEQQCDEGDHAGRLARAQGGVCDLVKNSFLFGSFLM